MFACYGCAVEKLCNASPTVTYHILGKIAY